MNIGPETSLSDLAFIVCTALDRSGITAILSGGGAATVHSENAYQSRDLDFIFSFWSAMGTPSIAPLTELGFQTDGGSYRHPSTLFTVEFPPGPLAIGSEVITSWETLRRHDWLLHILSPTDCVKDRLAWFLFGDDYSALEQALAVASRNPINVEEIERWCRAEGEPEKFKIFEHRFKSGQQS